MIPMYRHAIVNSAVCSDSAVGLIIMFSIMFSISIIGMIMILLRSAMFPYKKVYAWSPMDDEKDEWEEYQASG